MTQTTPLLHTVTTENSDPETRRQKICDGLKDAIDDGKMGDIVSNHETLILHYYQDVLDQAKQSFDSARFVAGVGFFVLMLTLFYKLGIDFRTRYVAGFAIQNNITPSVQNIGLTAGEFGLLSGAIIEFIAGVNFWLYARVAKQFGAFHICLERTHRYLLAYKIADQLEVNKDETLRDLVCIMANAPMITRDDIDSDSSGGSISKSGQHRPLPTDVKKLQMG